MDVTVDAHNKIDVLRSFFEGLEVSDKRKILNGAFRRASKRMITDMKAGVTSNNKSGNLFRSIGSIEVPKEIAIWIGARRGGGQKGWHGHFLENGTQHRFRRTMKNAPTGRVIGTRFIETAYRRNEEPLLGMVEQETLKSIELYIKRINRKVK